ncbi:hypothetical protein TrVE_jg6616 [Triparma verrucosa]|uniref:Ion transport domain-containing protein n=1 Tax=Triparma verrucosa TaxID=1606542 RepID=A0A9W7BV71_9STRA|nr:hypothetical protein TrVE_jg6616 [Triparma verrucosa]
MASSGPAPASASILQSNPLARVKAAALKKGKEIVASKRNAEEVDAQHTLSFTDSVELCHVEIRKWKKSTSRTFTHKKEKYLRSKSRRRAQLEKLFHKMNDGIRYSLTPIHAALIVAQAFTESSYTEAVEEIQSSFRQFANDCGDMARDFLDHVIETEDWRSKWDEILMKPIGGMTCIEIALDVKLYSFLIHPKVIRFVDSGWMGEGERVLTYTLKNPDTLDIIFYNKDECIKFGRISSTTTMRICAREIFEDFASSVNDLLDPTLVIMSPLARFAFNFTFFVMRVLVQQLVLLTEYDESHHGKLIFDNLEILHATICVGFLMAEVQELKTAYSRGQLPLRKYWRDGWNWLDWSIQIIFVTYLALSILSCVKDTEGDYALAEEYFQWSRKVLAGNSIVLWIRMLDYLSLHRALGPAVRVMALMVNDLITFSIVFAFVLIGFGSAFQTWFRSTIAFGTIPNAIVSLFAYALGEFSFSEMREESQVFGQIVLAIFLFIGTIMLLNLLIAILSHTYEKVQQRSKEEYRMGKAKIFLELAWTEDEIYTKGVPLPASLNFIRVLTFPCRIIFGSRVEKLLNLGFFVLVIDILLFIIMAVYVTLFFVWSAFATANSGFFSSVILEGSEGTMNRYIEGRQLDRDKDPDSDSDDDTGDKGSTGEESEDEEDKFGPLTKETGKGNVRGSFIDFGGRHSPTLRVIRGFFKRLFAPIGILTHLVEFMLMLPIVLLVYFIYLGFWRIPQLILTAMYAALGRQARLMKLILSHGKGDLTQNVSARELRVRKKWVKASEIAVKVAQEEGIGGGLMKWSKLKQILKQCGIKENNYNFSSDEIFTSRSDLDPFTLKNEAAKGLEAVKATRRGRQTMMPVTNSDRSLSRSSTHSHRNLTISDDSDRESFSSSRREEDQQIDLHLHHAFLFRDLYDVDPESDKLEELAPGAAVESHSENIIGDDGTEDADMTDFIILYQDFIHFMLNPGRQKDIVDDPSVVLPHIRAKNVVTKTSPEEVFEESAVSLDEQGAGAEKLQGNEPSLSKGGGTDDGSGGASAGTEAHAGVSTTAANLELALHLEALAKSLRKGSKTSPGRNSAMLSTSSMRSAKKGKISDIMQSRSSIMSSRENLTVRSSNAPLLKRETKQQRQRRTSVDSSHRFMERAKLTLATMEKEEPPGGNSSSPVKKGQGQGQGRGRGLSEGKRTKSDVQI